MAAETRKNPIVVRIHLHFAIIWWQFVSGKSFAIKQNITRLTFTNVKHITNNYITDNLYNLMLIYCLVDLKGSEVIA